MIEKIFKHEYMTYGTIISPNDAFLVTRGLRTLALRMKHVQEVAGKLVDSLKTHEKIRKVIYPFDSDFPQYELAKKQMRGGSGLFSIVLNVDRKEHACRF